MIFLIETLTARTALFSVAPRILTSSSVKKSLRCYVVDATAAGWFWARFLGKLTGVPFEILKFRLIDVRDSNGTLVRLRLPSDDIFSVQSDLMANHATREFLSNLSPGSELQRYLAKRFAAVPLGAPLATGQALFLIQLALWKRNQIQRDAPVTVFLESRVWPGEIQSYGEANGVSVRFAPSRFRLRLFLKNKIRPWVPASFSFWGKILTQRRAELRKKEYLKGVFRWFVNQGENRNVPASPKIAVEYYGHLNIDRPENHSDLFLFQQSKIPGENFTVLFGLASSPLNERKKAELTSHSIGAVAIRPEATTVFDAPVYSIDKKVKRPDLPRMNRGARVQKNELAAAAEEFNRLKSNWLEVFLAEKIKVYLTWYKYDASHVPIAQAMKEAGGVLAVYPRAFDNMPSAELAITSDIVFGSAPAGVELERKIGSKFSYYIATGYIGDHRTALLREKAAEIRRRLQSNGAKKIMAYFDENSLSDERWHTGHGLQREGYEFFLKKVLADPALGMVCKPKIPGSLRQRLGPVASLLKAAEETGRCVVLESGEFHSATPPVLAALASDVAVHSCLAASTAGVEAALAGVPTILVDPEGWPEHKLHKWGEGRFTFRSWQAAWDALSDHWSRAGGVPGFADWKPFLDMFDPFRDGRGAERMAGVVQDVFESLKAGESRETAMEKAVERYVTAWGKDKVAVL